MDLWLSAIIMGVVEGLTEFLPVSSTGHLILAGEILHFDGPPGKVFEVSIQLGAVLAICTIYFQRLKTVALGLTSSVKARRFVSNVFLAFLPAVVIGLMLHKIIKSLLFSPYVVCVSLIVGGLFILWVERLRPANRYESVEYFPAKFSILVGLCQCLAMIPGVSRSGATILSAWLMGADRKAATEFSFFLAIPTMMGATVLDLAKNAHHLHQEDLGLIGVGFSVAFVSALLVVRSLVAFIGRFGFTPFGWYRLAVGSVGLALLLTR